MTFKFTSGGTAGSDADYQISFTPPCSGYFTNWTLQLFMGNIDTDLPLQVRIGYFDTNDDAYTAESYNVRGKKRNNLTFKAGHMDSGSLGNDRDWETIEESNS